MSASFVSPKQPVGIPDEHDSLGRSCDSVKRPGGHDRVLLEAILRGAVAGIVHRQNLCGIAEPVCAANDR
jgi:hypothetical protein